MARKVLITGIILAVIALVTLGIDMVDTYNSYPRKPMSVSKTPEGKTLEMEKLQKVSSLTDSEEFLGGFTTGGVVEEIFGNALVIQRFNEKGEKIFVTVPIAQDAEITSGKKEIALDKIKPGDKVFILLNQMQVILSGCPLEGVYVNVSAPEDLLLSVE